MKNKSLISVVLALVLVACIGTAAYAAEPKTDAKCCGGCRPDCGDKDDFDDWNDFDDDFEFSVFESEEEFKTYLETIEDDDLKKELRGLYKAYVKAYEEEESAWQKYCDAEDALLNAMEKAEIQKASRAESISDNKTPSADKSAEKPEMKSNKPEKESGDELEVFFEKLENMSEEELEQIFMQFFAWLTGRQIA